MSIVVRKGFAAQNKRTGSWKTDKNYKEVFDTLGGLKSSIAWYGKLEDYRIYEVEVVTTKEVKLTK